MNDQDKKFAEEEEIDLIAILANLLNFLKRYRFLMVLLTLLCLGLATFLSYKILQPHYSSEMIIHSEVLNASEMAAVFNSLNTYVKEEKYSLLSQKMNEEEAKVKTLEEVKVFLTNELAIDTKVEEGRDSTITLLVIATTPDLQSLQAGILNYIEGNDYIKKYYALYRISKQEELERIQIGLQRIDSLQKAVLANLSSERTNLMNVGGDLYENMIKLSRQERQLKVELAARRPVEVVEGLSNFGKPEKNRRFIVIVLGGGVGIILALAIGFFLDIGRAIKERGL
ncbi:MAG: Wzz/FepE/Etk N-terminal domain-containing protein [Thermonemataceae bacterium]